MGTLSLDRFTAGYDAGRPALTNVSISIESGRMVAVTGRSGSGKSTLLGAMAGTLAPFEGTVTLDGAPLRDRDHAAGLGVVLVPQDNGLVLILTAHENLQVALIANGHAPVDARRAATRWLDLLGLSEQHDQLVEEMSGGQQQRTAIARGLALQGSVLLADEVTSELDVTSRKHVLELLRAEAERGAAVVFATNDPEAAAECDGELRLVDGRAATVRDATASLVRGALQP